jgi:hypothetical protein
LGRKEEEISVTLILFTTHAPSALVDQIARHGHEVFEALAVSEVLALAEQHPNSLIVITPEIEQERATVIQQHWPTMRLHQRFIPMNVCLN